jgi:hypothetical protein
MSLSEDWHSYYESTAPETLERRASELVNPASGLANDFLNVYNEILMLIEMLPMMPELVDDIVAWRPSSYRAYFMQSQLPGRQAALDAYARLEPSFRALFEASVEKLAECGVSAVGAVERAVASGACDGGEQIEHVCADYVSRIRRRLQSTEQLVNAGRVAQGRDPQARVNELFSAA